jgi:polyhydroxyalkanoate synthase subunit PhaC
VGLVLWALLTFTVVATIDYLIAPAATDRTLVSRGPLPRAWRRLRTRIARVLAAILGWPHIVDWFLRVGDTPVATTPCEVVLRLGAATLTRFDGPRQGEPVLLIHSLVTTPWILDLTPGQSLAASLVDAGFDVFLLDWGDPGPDEARLGFDDHTALLAAIEDHVLEITGEARVHLVGYCAGGTVALVRSALLSDYRLGSLAVIATPVDCSVPGGMNRVLGSRAMKPVLALDADGCVPAQAIRESFHALGPRGLRSVRYGWRIRNEPARFQAYAALARWVWEQRRLGGALLFDTVRMIRENAVLGVLRDGRSGAEARRAAYGLDPLPLLACVAERDHIVPAASTLALADVPGLRVDVVRCSGGHVSMLTGSSAGRSLWTDLAGWLHAHGAGSVELAGTPRLRRRRRSASLPGFR